MEEEKELLLSSNDVNASTSVNKGSSLQELRKHYYFMLYVLLLHLVLLFSVVQNVLLVGYNKGQQLSIFPELRSLRHVFKITHATNHTKYSEFSGPPSKENLAAWGHLLQPLYFNASDVELTAGGAVPATAVKVKEGGYLAALGVYHEIHCLVCFLGSVKQVYNPSNISQHKQSNITDHLDHCIEVLRISTMCTGDLSLYTFSWPDNLKAGFLDPHSRSPRKCVDWGQLETYAWKRKIALAPTLVKELDD